MAGVYFIPAGSSSKNRDKSLDHGLPRHELQKFLSPPVAQRIEDHFEVKDAIYAWGTASEKHDLCNLEPNDYVVDVKNKEVVQIFQFAFFFRAEDTKLQEWIGWDAEKSHEEGRYFSSVFFLRNPQKTLHTEKYFFFNALKPTGGQNWLVGQRWFSNNEIQTAMKRSKTPTLEAFLGINEGVTLDTDPVIEKKTFPASISKPLNTGAPNTKLSEETLVAGNLVSVNWLDPVIAQITRLRNQSKTLEREHEDAVAHLFELLGYKRGSEIQFQRGRVDILIELEGAQKVPPIVIEVKRDWALSRGSTNYIHQAYKYALEQGARIVVVTNGDLFLMYDREKGLSLDEHFLGEFQLTQLTKPGLSLMSMLKKSELCFKTKPEYETKDYNYKFSEPHRIAKKRLGVLRYIRMAFMRLLSNVG